MEKNKNYRKKGPIVIEFNLSKAVIILIMIGVLISALTTVKVIKTIQKVKLENNFGNEDVDLIAENINNAVYISVNSTTISLQENDNTKLNIRIIYNGEEVLYKDTTTEWVTQSEDGGTVEIAPDGENLYITGKSVGTVTLYAKVTYNGEIIESNSVTITIKKELDPYYQKVTIFKYDAKAIFDASDYQQGTIFGGGTPKDGQGIYFSENQKIPNYSETIELSDYNKYNRNSPYDAYTGLVEQELDEDGNIQFVKPEITSKPIIGGSTTKVYDRDPTRIFDENSTTAKQIYTNVGIPFKSLGNGKYEFKSSEMEVNFENGEPKSNVNLVMQSQKHSYSGADGYKYQGFFPFNYNDGERAIYHFGMHAEIPFYMTGDGKANIGKNEDIIFEFSGDDDIWIFMDGQLVIDLGGIHNEISADINFATGEINVYKGKKGESGVTIKSTEYLTDKVGKDWNSDIDKQHKLDIFYLERGAGSSNCTMSFNLPMEVQRSSVIVHHYIDGTDKKLAEDTIIEGNDGDLYKAQPSTEIPPMYEVVEEKFPQNAVGIIEASTTKEVIYYYKLKEESEIDKQGPLQINSLTKEINYGINYKAAIKDYIGNVKITIVDNLPYEIDEEKSNISNGIYNKDNLTITWTGTYKTTTDTLTWDNPSSAQNEDVEVLENGNILINKDISLVYLNLPTENETIVRNTVSGTLESQEGLTETVEDSFETIINLTTNITVEKQWLGDLEENRPTEIQVYLTANGTKVETEQPLTLNKENGWTDTFEDLEIYDENNQEIQYDVEEIEPDGYFLSSKISNNIEDGIKYTLTNFRYGELTLTKVAQEDNNITLGGTEFKLYKFVGSTPNNELIDKDNVTSDWELVETYVTQEDGIIRLENLDKTFEYRLVETKTVEGRMLPKGQYKIEFIYGNYDTTDTTIKNIDGTLVRVTAVGNPLALVITEDNRYLIPNQKIFQMPSSGSFGVNDFYKIGISIIGIGFILILSNKFIFQKIKFTRKK